MTTNIDEPIPYIIPPHARCHWDTCGNPPLGGPPEPDEWDELGDVSDGPYHFGGEK